MGYPALSPQSSLAQRGYPPNQSGPEERTFNKIEDCRDLRLFLQPNETEHHHE
jgi:hypothetical protein